MTLSSSVHGGGGRRSLTEEGCAESAKTFWLQVFEVLKAPPPPRYAWSPSSENGGGFLRKSRPFCKNIPCAIPLQAIGRREWQAIKKGPHLHVTLKVGLLGGEGEETPVKTECV